MYNSQSRCISAYIDGELESQKTLDEPAPFLESDSIMYIGTTPPSTQFNGADVSQFVGTLSDVCIYDKVLSTEEVSLVHKSAKGLPDDAHPALQISFSESVCKMLVEALMRPSVDGSTVAVTSMKAHVWHILSQVF